MPQSFFLGPGCIYDEIGEFSFVVERHLAAKARPHIGLESAWAAEGPLYLLLFGASHQNQAVKPFMASGFDEDGGFYNRNAIGLTPREATASVTAVARATGPMALK